MYANYCYCGLKKDCWFLFYKLDHLNSVKTLNSFNPLDFKIVNRNTGLFLDYIDQSNTD